MDLIIPVMMRFLKYPVFVVCACKHHISISNTGRSPYPGFEKPGFGTWGYSERTLDIVAHLIQGFWQLSTACASEWRTRKTNMTAGTTASNFWSHENAMLALNHVKPTIIHSGPIFLKFLHGHKRLCRLDVVTGNCIQRYEQPGFSVCMPTLYPKYDQNSTLKSM